MAIFFLLVCFAASADTLDPRFRLLNECADDLRILQGIFRQGMQTDQDVQRFKNVLARARAAISVIKAANPHEILPLIAARSGPNKLVVSQLEEISRASGSIARQINSSEPIDWKSLRESIKELLGQAFAFRQPSQAKATTPLGPDAQKHLDALREIAKDPALYALLFKDSNKIEETMRPKVQAIMQALVGPNERINIEDTIAVVRAFEEDTMLRRGADDRILVRELLEIYGALRDRFGLARENLLKDTIVMQRGARMLLDDLRNTGKLPQDLSVNVVDVADLTSALLTQLAKPNLKRFAIISYRDRHAGLTYANNIAGHWRVLVVDSEVGRSLVKHVFAALKGQHVPLYYLDIQRQVDNTNCLTFVLEDLQYIAGQPDIFSTLSLPAETTEELTSVRMMTACWGLATQLLKNLPAEATRNCVVKRRGFERETRQEFIERQSKVRLVHDMELGGEVEKKQYLAIEKRAISNRIRILQIFLESLRQVP